MTTSALRLDVLREPNSLRLFLGQLISQICEKLTNIGMIWVISEQYGSRYVPWIIAVSGIPHLLLALKSGNWVSRWSPLRTVLVSDLARGLLFLVFGLLFPLLEGSSALAGLLILAFLSNVGGAFFNPAILSLPVHLARDEKLPRLTALVDSCFAMGNVLGPLASVGLYQWGGLQGIFVVNGLSYLWAAWLASRIQLLPFRAPEPEARPDAGHAESRRLSSLQLLRQDALLSSMLVAFLAMNLFLAPIFIFLPWYAKNVFPGGISALASLELSMGVGTVAGSVLLSMTQLPGTIWQRIFSALALMGGSYLGFAASGTLAAAVLAIGALGFFLSLANVQILTFLQTTTDPRDLPSVMALTNLIGVATLPVSMALAGWAIEALPAQQVALGCSVAVLALALATPLAARLKPGIRRIPT